MPDRADIARRHGIPHLAEKLVGETAQELEADAAARAALLQMFGGLAPAEEPQAEEPQPTAEGDPLPPADKPFAEYSEADWAAVHAESEQKRAERQESADEPVVPEGITPLQAHLGYTEYDRIKAERNAALVRSIHSGSEANDG